MANKNNGKQVQFGSKSAFVRGVPSDTPAKEVVSLAAKEGMKLSIGQVYNIRSVAKKRVDSPTNRRRGPAATAKPSTLSNGSGAEGQMRKLIAELGLGRAREVVAEVEAAFRG